MNSPFGVLRATLAFLTVAVLAGCGGGGGSTAIPSGGPSPAALISQNGNNITVSGSVTSIESGGFHMLVGGPGGYGQLRVFTNSSTTATVSIAIGVRVLVVGTGSLSAGVTATSVAPDSTSSPTPAPSATPPPASGTTGGFPSPSPTGAPIASPAGVTAWAGPIVAKGVGVITVNSGNGLFHTYFNGSTTIIGGTLNVGQYVRITGTGTGSTGITAISIAIYPSAPTTTTVGGQITAATPYGFTINTGSATVPVMLYSATVVGGAPLTVGANVSVVGYGAASTAVSAIQVVVSNPTPPPSLATPTPGPISQTHVLTEDYLGGRYGTRNISWSQAAPWLTYAQTGSSDSIAISNTGIKTQLYADPNRSQSGVGDYMAQGDESTFYHDCSGNRITYNYNGTMLNVMDVSSASERSRFQSFVANQSINAHWDLMYEDDGAPLGDFAITSFPYGLPCNYTDSAWLAAEESLNDLLPMPVIFNGLEALKNQNVSDSIALLDSTNTIGGNFEHCYTDNGQAKYGAWAWQATENSELQVGNRGKIFVCQGRNTNAADTQTDARLYALASFLLSYNPQTSVAWNEFTTPSGLHVLPESQLVLTNPVVPTPSSISGLLTSTGVYAREYRNCYISGQFVNACAVVVNSDRTSHTFPLPQYQHSLVISGSGILDGGTISTNGPPPPLTMGPTTAAIVFP